LAFTGKSLQSSVGVLMSYGTLKYRPFLFSGQKLLTLSQYLTLLAPRGNFQWYAFLNLHGSWHLLVKVCKVMLER